jgi:hypothetical protein
MTASLLNRQRYLEKYKSFRILIRLIRLEAKSKIRLPFRQTLFAWRHGFLRKSVLLNGINNQNVKNYLSDFNRYCKSPRINRGFSVALDNKVIFERFFSNFPGYVPENYFLIRNHKVLNTSESYYLRSAQDIVDLIFAKGAMVIKPNSGGGGRDIHIYKCENNTLFHNQKPVTPEEAASNILKLNDFLGCEFIKHDDYANHVFPHSTNTFRILTMWNYQENEPFIAIAVHRFGCNRTIPIDNFSQGGVSALININNGVLGKAVTLAPPSQVLWSSNHPDTGVPIEGIQVPDWDNIKEQILLIAKSLPFIPYIGWDIIKTREGIKILEANSHSGMTTLQVHAPLLSIPHVREFYKKFNIIH